MILDKITIKNDSGMIVEATAPVIISASRSTDIPAFYAKLVFQPFDKMVIVYGTIRSINSQCTFLLRIVRLLFFGTKNPKPILPYLHKLDERGIHYYFQFTLNDYINEGFEPNVPSIEERIDTFKNLSNMIGKEKVIWRFDPLIITKLITPRELLKRIWHIGNLLKGYTDKLVFSFVDVKAYRKVQNNLIKETACFTKEDVESAEMTESQRREIVDGLVKMKEAWKSKGWNITMATCGEEVELEGYGIEHNRCIDGELMKRILQMMKN